jgi:hypothetical protein
VAVCGASYWGGVARDWKHIAEAASLQLVAPPPSDAAVGDAERTLEARLSASLRDLYSLTDGLVDEWACACVLSLEDLTQQNRVLRRQFRDLYMPFEGLLLFGQLGNWDVLFQPRVPHDTENVSVGITRTIRARGCRRCGDGTTSSWRGRVALAGSDCPSL